MEEIFNFNLSEIDYWEKLASFRRERPEEYKYNFLGNHVQEIAYATNEFDEKTWMLNTRAPLYGDFYLLLIENFKETRAKNLKSPHARIESVVEQIFEKIDVTPFKTFFVDRVFRYGPHNAELWRLDILSFASSRELVFKIITYYKHLYGSQGTTTMKWILERMGMLAQFLEQDIIPVPRHYFKLEKHPTYMSYKFFFVSDKYDSEEAFHAEKVLPFIDYTRVFKYLLKYDLKKFRSLLPLFDELEPRTCSPLVLFDNACETDSELKSIFDSFFYFDDNLTFSQVMDQCMTMMKLEDYVGKRVSNAEEEFRKKALTWKYRKFDNIQEIDKFLVIRKRLFGHLSFETETNHICNQFLEFTDNPVFDIFKYDIRPLIFDILPAITENHMKKYLEDPIGIESLVHIMLVECTDELNDYPAFFIPELLDVDPFVLCEKFRPFSMWLNRMIANFPEKFAEIYYNIKYKYEDSSYTLRLDRCLPKEIRDEVDQRFILQRLESVRLIGK